MSILKISENQSSEIMNIEELSDLLNPLLRNNSTKKVIIKFNTLTSHCFISDGDSFGRNPERISVLHINLKGNDKRFSDPFFIKNFYEKYVRKNNITNYELIKNGLILFYGDTDAPLESDFF